MQWQFENNSNMMLENEPKDDPFIYLTTIQMEGWKLE
jgi:hypothetical protein